MKNGVFAIGASVLAIGLGLIAAEIASRRVAAPAVVHEPPAGPAPPPVPKRSKEEIAAACRMHIDAAFAEAQKLTAARAAAFAGFLREKKSGAKPFATAVTSWYGTWRVVKPWLPGADDDGHRHYVEGLFAEHLFTRDELAGRLKSTIEDAVRDLEGVQNRLAVALRQEISGSEVATIDTAGVEAEFRTQLDRIIAGAQWDAQKDVGALLAGEVVANVAAQVFLRLGVNAGILGAGAANSWWSAGVSILVSIIVNVAWEWYDDPTGDIEQEINGAIDRLAGQCETALSEELSHVNRRKQDVWRQATEQMILAAE
jgi:hypothetical protein